MCGSSLPFSPDQEEQLEITRFFYPSGGTVLSVPFSQSFPSSLWGTWGSKAGLFSFLLRFGNLVYRSHHPFRQIGNRYFPPLPPFLFSSLQRGMRSSPRSFFFSPLGLKGCGIAVFLHVLSPRGRYCSFQVFPSSLFPRRKSMLNFPSFFAYTTRRVTPFFASYRL